MAIEMSVEAPGKMGRKKGERKTVMIRVYEDDAEKVNQAASERRTTVADFFSKHLLPCTEKAHREYIKAESKRLEGGEK